MTLGERWKILIQQQCIQYFSKAASAEGVAQACCWETKKVNKKRKIETFKGLYANVFKKEEEYVLAFHQGAAILSTPKELCFTFLN